LKSGKFLSHFYARRCHSLEKSYQESDDIVAIPVGGIHGKSGSYEPCMDFRGQVVDLDPPLSLPEENTGQLIR
jgi:hypothetical protein